MLIELKALSQFSAFSLGISLSLSSLMILQYFLPFSMMSHSLDPNSPINHLTQKPRLLLTLTPNISQGGLIVLYCFSGIFLGAILKEVKKKTSIPYSPMILISGLAIGAFKEYLGFLGDAVDLVGQINPHSLLMIFIPGLIFESAYNTDGFILGRSKWQILIMAGPGVVFSTMLSAIAIKLLNDPLTIPESLVIGSIVSTTDPVAVVALLKDLGASIKFSTLLEGESLLNDGTAYVVFLVCLDMVANDGAIDVFPSIIKFFRLSFGGPLVGLIVGWLCSYWIEVIMKDNTLIVIITAFCTYLLFYVSENYLEVSGILGLVALGVYLGTFCKVHLTHSNDHAVHTIWSFVGFTLETLIFLITGTFIGGELSHISLTSWDILKALAFCPILMAVRTVLMFI